MAHASSDSLTTMDTLTGALRSHLLGSALPAPVHVQLDLMTAEISVQVDHACTYRALADLLAWADSLHTVSARWWRTPTGSLHLTVRGRTTAGVHVHVYTGLWWRDCAELVQLAEGQDEGVSLAELRRLADQLRTPAVAA